MKRTRSSRRPRRTRRRTVRRIVRKARNRAFVKRVKKIVEKSAELKSYGATGGQAAALSNSFNVITITNVPDTTAFTQQTFNTRTGQEIMGKNIDLKMIFFNRPNTTSQPNFPVVPVSWVRVMILEGGDKQGQTIAPGAGLNMFYGVDGVRVNYTAIADRLESMTYKIDPMFYRTLLDRKFAIGNGGNGVQQIIKTMRIKYNKKIRFQERSEGLNLQNKLVWFVWWVHGFSNVNLFEPYGYYYNFRFTFTDIGG